MESLLQPIRTFLHTTTPAAWLAQVPQQQQVLLVDHANCELKAAQAAVRILKLYGPTELSQQCLNYLKPYEDVAYGRIPVERFLAMRLARPTFSSDHSPMVEKLLLLIREELHHFHQVLTIMAARGVAYPYQSSSRYAATLHRACRHHEPQRQIDMLIVGAYIEARSCERFAAMVPYIDEELGAFYTSLLRSEARHFEDYLQLAQQLSDEPIDERVTEFGRLEAQLIDSVDDCYRFHSGVVPLAQ
ncbi:tRNA isopentenyl-2-thiomethyl-A-37 hydroxylase MiaE [uncultured Ferrimonas sp.]|uniref:tRNA-(ms[2]io[6]A)-hydroxylase n=1 Tax=uncultured Ferrimonas sp. TaxID=432640 RepID=UPI00260BA860|nr:tRNA isopentenyl-2-thiomethyl-A-37 hydroxylase MiaE [uncultured Ferrimonas sp.]